MTGHPLTRHICGAQSVHKRGTHTTRLAQVTTDCSVIFVRLKRVESSSVAHVPPVVALSLAVHLEHTIFLIHSSFYHDTRTRSTTGATRTPPRTPSSSCASPSSPSRQAAPSRITLAWKPAEWRKPAHNNSHRNNIFLVLWHGRSREEMCGKILRTCKENDSTMKQSRNTKHGCPSIWRRKNEWVGEFSAVCSQIVLKCLYSARVGRPDILWSVNKFARAFTKWTKSCDKRLARLISYIHHTSEYRQCGHVWKHSTTMQTWIISRLWFCRRPWRLKINLRKNSVHFRKSHVCANKLDVQETDFSFTQFYRIWNHFSRCRFTHGRYSRSLWDLVVEVFHSVPNRTDGLKREPPGKPSAGVKPNMRNPIPIKNTNVIPTNIDHTPSNTTHSNPSAMLYVFDNEAVIKMIIKSRSPTMRHVPRAHRAALDWLFDKIHLDPRSISVLTPNNRLADMLTKRNFTRDEWNNLLHLFNISHFSSICCTKNFSLKSCTTMATRNSRLKRRKSCVQVATSSDGYVIFLLRQVLLPHQVRLHLKVLGSRQLRENPTAGWVLSQTHSTQRRLLKCDERMHTLAGWWKCSCETGRIEKKKIQKTPTILRLRPSTTKWNLLPRKAKLWRTPLHTEPVLQLTKKIKRIRKRRGTTISTYRRTHRTIWKPSSSWSGRSMENHLAIQWKIWLWTWLFGECSWIPLFVQQFISEKTVTLIWDL